jgi:hypothetical protein
MRNGFRLPVIGQTEQMVRLNQNKAFDFSTTQLRMLPDQTLNLSTLVRRQWPKFYNRRDTVNPGKTHPFCLQQFSIDSRCHIDTLKQLA